ncbi:unnamed protein product [Parnassius mnemosyne]
MKMRTLGVNLSKVVVHIDLKGSPPKLAYLESVLPLFKDLGVNALLMEYEDMFPYKGNIASLSSNICYKEHELRQFITAAGRAGFEIIPLIQTFGHLEHALKLSEFNHLREVLLYPDSICPSKIESMTLIKDMLKQIVLFHNSIYPLKHLHIGFDEVFHMNKCAQCRLRNETDLDIYFNHLQKVKYIVKLWSPNTTVLIWDDMLRGIKLNDFEHRDLTNTEPVYWDYAPFLRVSHNNLYKYHKNFENIWIASAFKGAEGRTATLPSLRNRFINHVEWLKFIFHYKFGGENKIYNFKGIILTGWSRYSHMDPLCEILPVSIPSLVLNLLLIKFFQEGQIENAYLLESSEIFNRFLKNNVNKHLQCEDDISLENFETSSCTFNGHQIYSILEQYIFQNDEILDKFNDVKEGLFSLEYYYKLNHLNMNTILPAIKWCNESLLDLIATENKIFNLMLQYYDVLVVQEYVNYKFYDGKKKLIGLLKLLKHYYINHTWYRNPPHRYKFHSG